VKILLIAPLLFVVGFCAHVQQTKQPPKAPVAPYTIPEDAVHQANPVKATPESIADGKKWYGYEPLAGWPQVTRVIGPAPC
jgi:hypothetical protein